MPTDGNHPYFTLSLPRLRELVFIRGIYVPDAAHKRPYVEALCEVDSAMADGNNPMPAIRWDNLTDEAIERGMTRIGLARPQPADRASDVALLTDAGIQPWQCLELPALMVAPPAPVPQPPPRIRLPKPLPQTATETVAAMFTRLDGAFAIQPQMTDEDRFAVVFQVARPEVANYIGERLLANPRPTYQEIRQPCVGRFDPSTSEFLTMYQTVTKERNESFVEMGRRLQSAYLGSLGMSETQITAEMRPLMRTALRTQLLSILHENYKQYVQETITNNPDIEWLDLLRRLDAHNMLRRSTQPRSNRGSGGSRGGYRGGTRGNRGGRHTQERLADIENRRCFICHEQGHVANSCAQGNAGGAE
jgi:hypothetical protein